MAHLPPDEWIFSSERLETTFKRGDNRYYCPEPKEFYKMLAMSPSRVPEPVYQLLGSLASRMEMRLIVAYTEGPLWSESDLVEDARRKRSRFRAMLHNDARTDARRAMTHVLRDSEQRYYILIWPDIYLHEPYELSKYIAAWLANEAATPWAEQLQPIVTQRYQVPNSGSLVYAFTLRGEDDELVRLNTNSADREALYLKLIPYEDPHADGGRARGGDRMHIKIRGTGGVKLSHQFRDRHIAMIKRRESLGMSGVLPDPMDGVANALEFMKKSVEIEQEYVQYKKNIISTMQECIDLSENEPCWTPNGTPEITLKLLELIKEDIDNPIPYKRFTFPRSCNYLNRIIAKESAPGTHVWFKKPYYDNDGQRAGSDVEKVSLKQFLEKCGITLRVPAPEDPDECRRYLREVKIEEKRLDYLWIEWFLRHGCREVLSTRFQPLRISQSVTDKDQLHFINLFQGFRCHTWINNSLSECRRLYEQDSEKKETAAPNEKRADVSVFECGPLKFLLDHVKNICGGDEETAKVRHAWNALLCYYPDIKPPTWWLHKGPPGCGKTSFMQAFARMLLNKAHTRTVTAIEHLVGHFNADSERTVVTVIEEMDFKDAKSKAMQALQELVSCKELRGERKGVDAGMRGDFNHFVAHSNVESPVIVPKDQRRLWLCDFSRVTSLKMTTDPIYKHDYLDRLARVLADEDVWKAYAYYLHTTYCATYEMAMTNLQAMHLRRAFNWTTTRMQLSSMIFFSDTSVLGWLFMCVARHTPFSGDPACAFVYQHDIDDEEFWKWPKWNVVNARNKIESREDRACKMFKNHSWLANKLADTDRWWHKELRQNVYKRYCDTLRAFANSKYHTVCLSEPDFFAELRRLLTTLDEQNKSDRVALLEYSESVPRKDELIALEWLCFAPLRQLRERISQALPPAWNFSWEAYYEQTK